MTALEAPPPGRAIVSLHDLKTMTARRNNSGIPMQQIPLAVAQRIEVHTHAVARFLTHYYWLLVLVSLALFLSRMPGPGMEERFNAFWGLSFYPLFLVVGSMVKRFLQQRIVIVFSELRQTGALQEEAFPSLVEDLQRRIDRRRGDLFGIAGGLSIAGFYYIYYSRPTASSASLPAILVGGIDVLLAYVISVAAWKAVVTASEIRQLGLKGQLRIHPFHPDGCAGLGAIGHFCVSLSLILISIGLFLCGWLLYAYWIPYRFGNVYYFEPWFVGGLIVLIIVSHLAFFFPLMTVHHLMTEQAAHFVTQLAALAARIAALEESLLSQGSHLGHEAVEAQDKEIQTLRSTYAQRRNIPTWPIDWQTLTKFLSAQTLLSIGFLSSLFSLWEKGWNFWKNILNLWGSS